MIMERDIELGKVGALEIKFDEGVASVSISAAVPGEVGIEGGAFVKCSSVTLIEKLFEAIEKKLPDHMDPIAETVKVIIINAVKAIK